MSRLETKAKPILVPLLTGNRIALSKYYQEVLATWIAMKLIICEFSDPNDVVTPSLDRSLLMGRRTPPNTSSIWIGHYGGATWNNAYFRDCYEIATSAIGEVPNPPNSPTKNTQSQSLIAGKPFIHALGTTVPDIKFEPRRTGHAINALRQIWPFQREFSWPPLLRLNDIQASLIATELSRYARGLPARSGIDARWPPPTHQ
jgi:hypothetical protein